MDATGDHAIIVPLLEQFLDALFFNNAPPRHVVNEAGDKKN